MHRIRNCHIFFMVTQKSATTASYFVQPEMNVKNDKLNGNHPKN